MNPSKNIPPNSEFSFIVSIEEAQTRLDVYLSKQFSGYSRSYFQKLIDDKHVLVNDRIVTKGSFALKENDKVFIKFPAAPELDHKPIINEMGIKIIFEHPDFLIIDKPAGVIVHAAQTSDKQVTLVDWLISKFKEISQVGSPDRPGIVHRLDMNTSGLMVIPRNNYAHNAFGKMFKEKQIKKTYLALVQGHSPQEGVIDFPIARHPSGSKMTAIKKSIKLAMFKGDAREAITNFKTLEYYKEASFIQANPQTGRTHQIRVHFAAIGHPLLGDILYGKKSKFINRQALHAQKLEFDYENEFYSFTCPLPQDFQHAIYMLQEE